MKSFGIAHRDPQIKIVYHVTLHSIRSFGRAFDVLSHWFIHLNADNKILLHTARSHLFQFMDHVVLPQVELNRHWTLECALASGTLWINVRIPHSSPLKFGEKSELFFKETPIATEILALHCAPIQQSEFHFKLSQAATGSFSFESQSLDQAPDFSVPSTIEVVDVADLTVHDIFKFDSSNTTEDQPIELRSPTPEAIEAAPGHVSREQLRADDESARETLLREIFELEKKRAEKPVIRPEDIVTLLDNDVDGIPEWRKKPIRRDQDETPLAINSASNEPTESLKFSETLHTDQTKTVITETSTPQDSITLIQGAPIEGTGPAYRFSSTTPEVKDETREKALQFYKTIAKQAQESGIDIKHALEQEIVSAKQKELLLAREIQGQINKMEALQELAKNKEIHAKKLLEQVQVLNAKFEHAQQFEEFKKTSDQYKAKCVELGDALKKAKGDSLSAQEKAKSHRAEVIELEAKLESTTQARTHAEKEIEKLRNEIRDLRSRPLPEQGRSTAEPRENIQDVSAPQTDGDNTKDILDAEGRANASKKEAEDLSGNVDRLKRALDAEKAKVAQLAERVAVAEKETAQAVPKIEELKGKLDAALKQIESSKKEVEKEKLKVRDAEAEKNKIQNELVKVQTEIKTLQKRQAA